MAEALGARPHAPGSGISPRAWAALVAHLELLKPRVVGLILFTAIAAAVAAARGPVPLDVLALIAGAVFLSGGGAAALNHWFDRDLDARMSRTRLRPIPSGRLARPQDALLLGLALIAAGVSLALGVNPAMATCLAGGAIAYVGIYTIWLKRRTPLAVVIGGSAGSAAVLAGWAAVEPSLGAGAWLLALLVFVWTPAHFWSLALAIAPDYRRAGVPMLPVVKSASSTKAWIALHVVACLAISAALVPLAGFGPVYTAGTGLAGLLFANRTLALLRVAGCAAKESFDLFKHSGIYLAIVFLAALLDGLFVSAAP